MMRFPSLAAQLAVRLHQRANVLLRLCTRGAPPTKQKQTNNNNKRRRRQEKKKKKRKRANKREKIFGRERERKIKLRTGKRERGAVSREAQQWASHHFWNTCLS
jgi:GR25 family glycosyltransferase involved in LPS biosynthesis